MCTVAILVAWPAPFKSAFIPITHGRCTLNLASIGSDASDKQFKLKTLTDDGWKWTDTHLYFNLTFLLVLFYIELRSPQKERELVALLTVPHFVVVGFSTLPLGAR